VRGFELSAKYPLGSRLTLSIAAAREWTDSARLEATPARGIFRPLIAVPKERTWRTDYGMTLAASALLGGVLEGAVLGRLRTFVGLDGPQMAGRLTAHLQYVRPAGNGSVVASAFGGIVGSDVPAQDLIRAGGPVTAPGYRPHQFTSRALVSQRLEWQFPVAFPSIPIGRWGRSPGKATLAPLGAVLLQEEQDSAGKRRAIGYPSVGAGLLVFFDLVRFDIARGIRNGRWTFGVDLSRDLWRIL
jgi:hypothetical protein